jgi:hypothetical protein
MDVLQLEKLIRIVRELKERDDAANWRFEDNREGDI